MFVSLGLGRFALGMLLPDMGEGLGLTYAEMGFISTGNFAGYLAAVLIAGWLARRFGARQTIFAGMGVVAATMILVGRADGFSEVLVLYVLTGIGSGAANVPVMALVSHWFLRHRRGRAAGFIVSGSGFAIVFTGLVLPGITADAAGDGWRTGWLVLGLVAFLGAVVSGWLLRDRPEDLTLAPVGGGSATADAAAPSPAPPEPARRPGILVHLGAVYFLFGATYPIYATFIVTTLVQERGFAEVSAGHFWAWVGFLSLFSGPLFGTLSDHIGRKAAMMIVFTLQMGAYALVAAPLPDAALYLSIGLFGICAWSIPSIMAAAVGDYMGAERAAAAFGFVTFVFGIGQMMGPAVAGVIADHTGGFAASYAMAAALAAVAVALAAFLRRPSH